MTIFLTFKGLSNRRIKILMSMALQVYWTWIKFCGIWEKLLKKSLFHPHESNVHMHIKPKPFHNWLHHLYRLSFIIFCLQELEELMKARQQDHNYFSYTLAQSSGLSWNHLNNNICLSSVLYNTCTRHKHEQFEQYLIPDISWKFHNTEVGNIFFYWFLCSLKDL